MLAIPARTGLREGGGGASDSAPGGELPRVNARARETTETASPRLMKHQSEKLLDSKLRGNLVLGLELRFWIREGGFGEQERRRRTAMGRKR